MKEIHSKSKIDANIKITGSKSITHRALIASSLAEGESVLESVSICDDTLLTLNALREFGAEIELKEDIGLVRGTGGELRPSDGRKEIFLGNSGTSFRLLLSLASLGKGEYLLTGVPRMNERPIGDLVNALNVVGVDVSCVANSGYPPVLVKASHIQGGKVKIPGNVSSQYISSILLSAPYAKEDIEIEVTGDLISRPYIDLTLDVMKSFKIIVENDRYRFFKVKAGKKYQSCKFVVDGDVSGASYFWGAAAITQGRVTTENIHPFSTRQGDIEFLNILEAMGCQVKKNENSVSVQGGPLKGVDVDMGSIPDMVPTLAAVALFAEGKTFIRNVAHLRYKESDRLGDTAHEWKGLGGMVQESDDGLVIHGRKKLAGKEVDPHNDHRLAMSLAMIGLKIPGIRIMNEKCVDKSFPLFWELFESL